MGLTGPASLNFTTQPPSYFRLTCEQEADARRFHISAGGVVLVTPEMLGQRLHYAR